MIIGLPKEKRTDETRVALSPDNVKKLSKKGFRVLVERSAGILAGFPDADYTSEGAELVDAKTAFSAEIILKVNRPSDEEISMMKRGTLLVCYVEPFNKNGFVEKLAAAGIDSMSVELIPRTSRAQSMDVLSS
ncbi:MAG: NAD(P)(+) transhydrogenase (Re/Si-specific) subunit alpha, partial [Bdellovibrionia bacterium]